MIPLIVIRPRPGDTATVAAAAALGLDARAYPLFEVGPVAWDTPDPETVDALLIGSANAVRHGGPGLARFLGKPAYVVGPATAEVCRAAGLAVAATGRGTLGGVVAGITGPRRLLRLAGREHVAVTPPPGVELVVRVVYASDPLPMPRELADMLRAPAVVALHSASAAEHFAIECDRLALDRGRIALTTIGPRVTAAAGTGWARIATAASPDDAALLAQARQLCQNRDGSPVSGAE